MVQTLHVVATTDEGTEAALRNAAALAAERQARIVLLIAHIDDRSARSTPWLVARYEAMARSVDQPIQIRLCLAATAGHAVTALTRADATVLIGGARGRFWPSVEQRLAARLRRAGRDVVFVATTATVEQRTLGVNVHA
jgi:hypothetical protein